VAQLEDAGASFEECRGRLDGFDACARQRGSVEYRIDARE
jgi:hypothetical protein